jgi:hypothetical protein
MAEYVDLISMNLNDPNLRPNDGGFQAVEPGTYEFEIEKQATGTSNAGNNVLKITGRVVGPEGNPMMGRTMVNPYTIQDTDFARGRMLSFLNGCGAPIDQNGSFSRDALVGLRFEADVEKRAGTTVDKMGNEVSRDFTSWVRERPVGSGPAVVVPQQTQQQQTQQAAPPKAPANTSTGNAPRRPQAPPNGNGQRRPQQ